MRRPDPWILLERRVVAAGLLAAGLAVGAIAVWLGTGSGPDGCRAGGPDRCAGAERLTVAADAARSRRHQEEDARRTGPR